MKRLVPFIVALSLALPAITFAAVTGVSFGGIVTAVQPCNTGLLAYVASPKPPYVTPVMWLWGELPFLSYLPPHPKQQLLGKLAPVTVPCVLGVVPYGVGFPIIYHGSSAL